MITSRNPATGEVLKEIPKTPLEKIPEIIEHARIAQRYWEKIPPKSRAQYILNAREYILDQLDEIAGLISAENGKPKTEAIVHDILPVCELMTAYAKKAPQLLRNKPIPLRVMKHRKSYIHYWPVGVVGVIAPWNFPFSIPFGEIVLALLSGNSVVLKPSEVTPQIGLKIAEIFENAGLPHHLFQVVIGDGAHGAAIIKSKVDKLFFTGSVATGKRVMAAAAESLTPVILELGGKDPMVVMPDADLDYATSAALWGAFANLGQVCASVERIIVHESIHERFLELLKTKVAALKHSPSGSGDLGSITYEKQKQIYKDQLAELTPENSRLVCGGNFSADGTFLEPTIVANPVNTTSDNCPIERLKIYREETFGPIVAVTKFRTTQQAITKANDTEYGLLASVIGRDTHLCEQVAKQIQAGSVLVNEVIYTHGLAETPWGGVKHTGMGRVHSDLGFYEFVNVRHIHKERAPFLVFKSPWWFPYTTHQQKMFRYLMDVLFRRSLWRRLTALPNLLVELVEMLKTEKRL